MLRMNAGVNVNSVSQGAGLKGQTICEDTVHVAFRSHPVFYGLQGYPLLGELETNLKCPKTLLSKSLIRYPPTHFATYVQEQEQGQKKLHAKSTLQRNFKIEGGNCVLTIQLSQDS